MDNGGHEKVEESEERCGRKLYKERCEYPVGEYQFEVGKGAVAAYNKERPRDFELILAQVVYEIDHDGRCNECRY